MENQRVIEYNRILNDSRSIVDLVKKGESLECKQISCKKLFNLIQLLLCKNMREIDKTSHLVIDSESLVICDLRTKNELVKSKKKINNSVECNSLDRVMKIFPKLKSQSEILDFKRKHVIIYDSDGTLMDPESLEPSQREILRYFQMCVHSIKSIFTLKGGFSAFNSEFPFICCSTDYVPISNIKSLKDIPPGLRSKIIASMEYPILIAWGKQHKIYLGNVLQGCHPQVLNGLGIKSILDFTTNGMDLYGKEIKVIRIVNAKEPAEEDLIYASIPLEETLTSFKDLERSCPDPGDIFPLMIVSPNITNKSVSIAAILVSYLRKWQITATLVFVLNQIGLDNTIISSTENEHVFKSLHPSNFQIAQLISFNFS
ncbi:putative mitogen-activated protein kinase phosphatase 1 [Cryptosporidium felis]|nr:putative mitogen-activated protein kinase phosphatase 1 [Cryptosporidium felis]